MTQQFHFREQCLGALAFAAAITTSAVVSAGPLVNVSDVEQLYAAVNDPLNNGAAVVLAPGIYLLSAKDPVGGDRPHGGRLELQRDMSLYGVAGDRAAVVIDAADPSRMPSSSFTFEISFGRSGVVRMGRGTNTIEWLTILGNPTAAAGIAAELTDPTEPIGTATTTIRVAHVVSSGSSRGIDVRNSGQGMIGRRIDAELVDNELIGPTEVQGMSEGIRVANFVGPDHGVIVARLSGNITHGFQIGCIVANNRSSNAAVRVRSSGDRFFANAVGCVIAGGLSQAATGVANSNSTVFEALGSEFVDNDPTIAGIEPGGIRVVGGLSTTLTNVVSDNTVSVSLTGSRVFGNEDALGNVVNFEAYGAIHTALTGLAGTNNHVTITLRGSSRTIDVIAADSLPVDPSGSNTVSVLTSPTP
jgi:hypothetical protein